MMRTTLALAGAALAFACGRPSNTIRTTETTSAEVCPVRIVTSWVRAEDAPDAAVLVVDTVPAKVRELQARFERIAETARQQNVELVAKSAEKGPLPKGTMLVPNHLTIERTDSGVRLIHHPVDPSQLELLQRQVHERADVMAMKDCPPLMVMGVE